MERRVGIYFIDNRLFAMEGKRCSKDSMERHTKSFPSRHIRSMELISLLIYLLPSIAYTPTSLCSKQIFDPHLIDASWRL